MSSKPGTLKVDWLKDDYTKIAKDLAGVLHARGFTGLELMSQFKKEYPRVTRKLKGISLDYDALRKHVKLTQDRMVNDNMIIQRGDKSVRYGERSPFFGRIEKLFAPIVTKKTDGSKVSEIVFYCPYCDCKMKSRITEEEDQD